MYPGNQAWFQDTVVSTGINYVTNVICSPCSSLCHFGCRYVKLLTIRHPNIKVELYQLATQTAGHLEKVHPGGKIVEGVSHHCTFHLHTVTDLLYYYL